MHLGAASVMSLIEVELLIGLEGFTAYHPLINSECCNMIVGSELQGAKVLGREGNNPEHRLRSRNIC